MDKLLVRLFGGLVAIVLALGLFSFLVTSISDKVRYEHYWSDLFSPVMLYVKDHALLDGTFLPEGVSVDSYDADEYSDVVNIRLGESQVVFDNSEGSLSAYALYNRHQIFRIDSHYSGETLYRVYLWLLANTVVDDPNEELSDKLNYLADKLNVGVNLISDADKLKSQVVLEALADDSVYIAKSDCCVIGFLKASNGEIYEVQFPEEYSLFSLPIVLFLLVSIIIALALAGYSMFQTLDRRLRNIETVASRMSRGELDARVKQVEDNDSISRLGLAFNSMADHIQRLMYVQKEMIHAVSHELRTPVARIRFGVQMIEDCPSEEALKKQITGIDGDIQELDELIDEILTYARLEQGGPILAFQEADIKAIVDQVITEQSSVKPDMKIFAEFKEGSEIWKTSEVEARYIHRSIQNLVGNGTRYADSTVKVVCSFDQETCRVDVEDDGPGIPEDDWESVFTPFARLDDSRTRSSGGYGLGLSIVRRILYWHGGQAFLGRSEMGGAKFSLVWPRKQPAE